jgi:hypothetical protein
MVSGKSASSVQVTNSEYTWCEPSELQYRFSGVGLIDSSNSTVENGYIYRGNKKAIHVRAYSTNVLPSALICPQ